MTANEKGQIYQALKFCSRHEVYDILESLLIHAKPKEQELMQRFFDVTKEYIAEKNAEKNNGQ